MPQLPAYGCWPAPAVALHHLRPQRSSWQLGNDSSPGRLPFAFALAFDSSQRALGVIQHQLLVQHRRSPFVRLPACLLPLHSPPSSSSIITLPAFLKHIKIGARTATCPDTVSTSESGTGRCAVHHLPSRRTTLLLQTPARQPSPDPRFSPNSHITSPVIGTLPLPLACINLAPTLPPVHSLAHHHIVSSIISILLPLHLHPVLQNGSACASRSGNETQ